MRISPGRVSRSGQLVRAGGRSPWLSRDWAPLPPTVARAPFLSVAYRERSPLRQSTLSEVTDIRKALSSDSSIALHWTLLPASTLRPTTRRATGHAAPKVTLYFSLITFRRVFSACFHRLLTDVDRIEQICRIETFDVNLKSNTERELQPTATPQRATPRLLTWIERVLPYPSLRVFPGHPESTSLIGTPACA